MQPANFVGLETLLLVGAQLWSMQPANVIGLEALLLVGVFVLKLMILLIKGLSVLALGRTLSPPPATGFPAR